MNKKKEVLKDFGSYFWRGGKRIELEEMEDRFTVMPVNEEQLQKVSCAPGVRNIKRVNGQVYKVETTATEREAAITSLRSEAYNTIAHHAYRPKGIDGTVYYLTDKIIIRFKPDTSMGQIDQLLRKYSLRFIKEYDDKLTFLLQVTSESKENPIKVSNRLAEESIVDFAEVNTVNRFQRSFIPKDSLFKMQWHLKSKKGVQLVADASINVTDAWDITKGSRDIVVCILDDGFSLDHPDFQGQGKVVFPKDFVDGDSNPFPGNKDYHGTPCAGVAVAESNGTGVVGAAPGCAFMPVRFDLSVDDDKLIDIFNYIKGKADVISCSWGPVPCYAPLSKAVFDTLKDLATNGSPRGKGCVICFAATNFDASINDPVNSGGFIWKDYNGVLRKTTGPILNGNATHPDVIAVAASTSLNKHAAYSNWGAEISVCAPSNNFHPIDSHTYVQGRGIWTTDNEAYGQGFASGSIYTGEFGGTSSATPLVAGVAALVLSANSDLSAAEVKEILQSTADKIVDKDLDIILGINRGQYDANGHCDWFGYGKVNAAKAVAEAFRRKGS